MKEPKPKPKKPRKRRGPVKENETTKTSEGAHSRVKKDKSKKRLAPSEAKGSKEKKANVKVNVSRGRGSVSNSTGQQTQSVALKVDSRTEAQIKKILGVKTGPPPRMNAGKPKPARKAGTSQAEVEARNRARIEARTPKQRNHSDGGTGTAAGARRGAERVKAEAAERRDPLTDEQKQKAADDKRRGRPLRPGDLPSHLSIPKSGGPVRPEWARAKQRQLPEGVTRPGGPVLRF